jgi:dienelactone hydrolase
LAILAATCPALPSKAEVKTKTVSYEVKGETMKGFLAYDDQNQDPRPGILVVHEWWGLNDYTRRRARMLAEMGYVAFALDMYGAGKNTSHPKEASAFAKQAMSNMTVAKQRFMAARNLLAKHELTSANQIAAIGYCFGGGVVLQAARSGIPLQSVVSFHGSLASDQRAEPDSVKARVLVLHGEKDPMITDQHIADLAAEMALAAPVFEFVSYPDATHGFTNPAADEAAKKYDLPIAYNKTADEKSWQKMQSFLRSSFGQAH